MLQFLSFRTSQAPFPAWEVSIIIDILWNRQKKLGTTYHCILLGISLSDVVGSLSWPFRRTWLPSFESGTVDGRSVFGASGTQRTCSVQGFFIQVGMAAPLYSGVLSVHYLLMVRYGWNENSNKKVSTWEHLSRSSVNSGSWNGVCESWYSTLQFSKHFGAGLLLCRLSVKAEDGQWTCVASRRWCMGISSLFGFPSYVPQFIWQWFTFLFGIKHVEWAVTMWRDWKLNDRAKSAVSLCKQHSMSAPFTWQLSFLPLYEWCKHDRTVSVNIFPSAYLLRHFIHFKASRT